LTSYFLDDIFNAGKHERGRFAMVNIEEIYGYMGKRRVSKSELARMLSVSNVTMYKRFRERKFNTNEVLIIVKNLDIPEDEISYIFFNQEVARQDTI
jgi:hypothetical protein